MEKIFQQPQIAFDTVLRVLCWGLLVLSHLAYGVLYPALPPEFRPPFALLVQSLLIVAMSIFAVAPAMRDIRDILAYEWIWLLIWNIGYFAKCDWYEPSWFVLALISNWMSILAAVRLLWFSSDSANNLRTDWPIFGILGFITRRIHAPLVAPTQKSATLVWLLIVVSYPLAWIASARKFDVGNAWLISYGAFVICFYGKKAAIGFRDHVKQSLQTQAELADILPQFESLKASLVSSAANHPPIRTREEAMVAMQKWLSEDERSVLDAMRRTHPAMIQPLVDSMINLAGNKPRPGLTLVHSKDGE